MRPLHNEETLIGRAIQSVLQSADAAATKVLVVVHNCTDATAEKASPAISPVLGFQKPPGVCPVERPRCGAGYPHDPSLRAAGTSGNGAPQYTGSGSSSASRRPRQPSFVRRIP